MSCPNHPQYSREECPWCYRDDEIVALKAHIAMITAEREGWREIIMSLRDEVYRLTGELQATARQAEDAARQLRYDQQDARTHKKENIDEGKA